jgi:hypothetical protein
MTMQDDKNRKDQTGEHKAVRPWRVNVPAPRAWQRPLRSWSVNNDMDMEDIVAEALELWAEQQGIKLPPRTPREPVSSQEPDQRTWGMNSAF